MNRLPLLVFPLLRAPACLNRLSAQRATGVEEDVLDVLGIDVARLDVILHCQRRDDADGLAHEHRRGLEAGGAASHAGLGEVLLGREKAVEGFGDEAFERDGEGAETALAEGVGDVFGAVQV